MLQQMMPEFAIETANVQQFNNGSWSALSNPDDHWNRYYAGISKCCTLLETPIMSILILHDWTLISRLRYANNLKDIRMWRAELVSFVPTSNLNC